MTALPFALDVMLVEIARILLRCVLYAPQHGIKEQNDRRMDLKDKEIEMLLSYRGNLNRNLSNKRRSCVLFKVALDIQVYIKQNQSNEIIQFARQK